MKRARDIRDQLEGLLERVEIEVCSNASDLDAIKKAITSGTAFMLMMQLLYLCKLPEIHKSDKLVLVGCRFLPPFCTVAEEWFI